MDKIKSWITSHKLISAVIALILVGGVAYGLGNSNNKDSSQNGSSSQNSTNGTSKGLSIAKESKGKEGKIWFLIKQNSSASESNMPSLKSSVSEIIYIKNGEATTYDLSRDKVMRDFIGKSDKDIISEAKKLDRKSVEDRFTLIENDRNSEDSYYTKDQFDEAKNKLDNYKDPKPEKISFEGEIYDDGDRLKTEKINYNSNGEEYSFKTSTNVPTVKLLKEIFSGYRKYESSSSSSSSPSYLITKVPNDKTYYILDNPKNVKEIR